MNTVVAVLDFLLLVATLRLVAWPLVNRPPGTAPASGTSGTSGGQGPGTLIPERPTVLLDRLEREVSARKAMLARTNCPACGQPVTAQDRFCRSCGGRLSTQDGEP